MRSSPRSSLLCRPRSISSALLFCSCLVAAALSFPAAAKAQDDPEELRGSVDDEEKPAPVDANRVDGGTKGAGEEGAKAAAAASMARFDAALRLVTTGKERTAAAELLHLAHERPGDDIAPEALFEAGILYEEHVGDPEAARRCYRELVERYPSSRLLRRAQQRVQQLDTALRTGAAPLLAFQAIVRTTAEGSAERRTRLVALLAQNPDFALADQVLFLLADTALRAGDRPGAEQYLGELYRRFPKTNWAAQGHRMHAEMLLQAHRIAEARAQYELLESFSGPLWPLLAREGKNACRQAERWLYLDIFAWVYLLAGGLLVLVRHFRRLWPPPFELLYYAPVAALLSLMALLLPGGQSSAVATPIWQLGLAGTLLSWLAAAAARDGIKASGAARFRWLVLEIFLRGIAVAALFYLLVYHHGLLELVVETLRNGPDSGM